MAIEKLIERAQRVAGLAGFAKQLLRAVAPSSIQPLWHPLGFIHMRLADVDCRVLRLHLWSSEFAQPMLPVWPVHNHVFSLRSLVVSGVIRNLSFSVTPTAHGERRLFEVAYDSEGSRRVRTDAIVSCRCTESNEHRQGDIYRVEAGVFHASELASGRAALTLVETTGGGGRPLVVGDVDGREEYRFAIRPVDPAVLNRVAEELDAADVT